MSRRLIALFASIVLLCAGLLGTSESLWFSAAQAASPTATAINTDDGVSLDESVLDDLRPSTLAEASPLASLLDLLMSTSAWQGAFFGSAAHAIPHAALSSWHAAPCLEGPLRPPSRLASPA